MSAAAIATTQCQAQSGAMGWPVRWPLTMQERLRWLLLEMPMTRAEVMARAGWTAKQTDGVIEQAMRKGYVVPLHEPGRTRRSYAVRGFVPVTCTPVPGTPLSCEEQLVLLQEMEALVQA